MLKQANDRRSCWADFYRDCRLLPQMEFARSQGRLPPERERLVMRVVDHLDTLLAGLDTRPALLHGDLWSGNILSAGEEPAVVDPAIYFGEREMEIQLQGGGILSDRIALGPVPVQAGRITLIDLRSIGVRGTAKYAQF